MAIPAGEYREDVVEDLEEGKHGDAAKTDVVVLEEGEDLGDSAGLAVRADHAGGRVFDDLLAVHGDGGERGLVVLGGTERRGGGSDRLGLGFGLGLGLGVRVCVGFGFRFGFGFRLRFGKLLLRLLLLLASLNYIVDHFGLFQLYTSKQNSITTFFPFYIGCQTHSSIYPDGLSLFSIFITISHFRNRFL